MTLELVGRWQPLPSPFPKTAAHRIDPYLWLAHGMGFADHLAHAPTAETAFDVSIEVASASPWPEHAGLTTQAAHAGSRYVTGKATLAALAEMAQDPSVLRLDFAQPLLPQRAPASHRAARKPQPTAASTLQPTEPEPNPAPVLLGMIDNGCPFAHADLQRTGKTRILSLWDQNPGGEPGSHSAAPGFDYGTQWTRADLHTLMLQATDTGGAVDEAQCYRMAGQTALRHSTAHGAYSLGLLAGTRRWNGRPNAKTPMQRADANDVSSCADIVFVQLPQVLMDCVSVAALEHKALDGLRHIYITGQARDYKHIVVSFGYESWVGPHNGSSWFEAALAAMVQQARDEGIDLKLVMIAGNSKDQHAHAEVVNPAGCCELSLAVPPDNEVPTFVELWVPAACAAELRIDIVLPGGRLLPTLCFGEAVAWPSGQCAQLAVVMQRPANAEKAMHRVLVRIAPTRTVDARQAQAPHGQWTIGLSNTSGGVYGIHAYIGRVEADSQSPHRGRQARFVGRTPEELASDRAGTLNGHACGSGVIVAGAHHADWFPYLRSPGGPLQGHSTRYSGAGPSLGALKQPFASVAVDDGLVYYGRLGTGTRSAGITRLSGTSAAAPLLARCLADDTPLSPRPPSPPGTRGSVDPVDLALGESFVNEPP